MTRIAQQKLPDMTLHMRVHSMNSTATTRYHEYLAQHKVPSRLVEKKLFSNKGAIT